MSPFAQEFHVFGVILNYAEAREINEKVCAQQGRPSDCEDGVYSIGFRIPGVSDFLGPGLYPIGESGLDFQASHHRRTSYAFGLSLKATEPGSALSPEIMTAWRVHFEPLLASLGLIADPEIHEIWQAS